MREEEFSAGEICVSSKVAMGMFAADGDETAMVTSFCVKLHDGCEHD